MKKNKFLTLVLAICMILPAMFALTACGKSSHTHTYGEWSTDAIDHWHVCSGCNETEKSAHTFVEEHNETQYWNKCSVCGYEQDKVTGTVTEDEWKSALNFENVTNFNYRSEGLINNKDIKANATSASSIQTSVSNGDIRSQYFYKVVGDDVYQYTYIKDNVSDLSKDLWTYKKKTSTSADEIFSCVNPKKNYSAILDAFTSFEYNAETSIYASTSTVTYSGVTVNLKLKFADKKLIWTEWTFTGDDSNAGQSEHCDISYDEVNIELPNLSAVTADEWNKALSFNGLTNYTINLDHANTTEKISVDTTKVKYETTTGSKTTTSVFDIEGKQRFDKSSADTRYTKTAFNTTNLSTLLASSEAGKSTAYVSSLVNAFDSFEYRADEKVYYIAQATIKDADATDIKLTFDNRRLAKLEYTTTVGDSTQTNTLTYTYNNTTVTLPTASETVTKANYDAESNKFVCEGVALTKGENVFEIEISDETHASYSIGGVYIVSGTFNTTSDTTSKVNRIIATNASDTEITNLNQSGSSYWYGMMFKDLSAGKYYITVTATENCTGDFKLGFTTNATQAKAVTVPYSAGFSLANVKLSSGNNWFEVEISDETHSASKVQGSSYYLLNGNFTLSDDSETTLTITAKNSSNGDVVNSAKTGVGAVNGAMKFKELSAGKYYICINATADCTGSFSLIFLTKDM